MIELHECPHCKKPMRMWLPWSIEKPPIVLHDCGNQVDFSFVYKARKSSELETKELQQLSYLRRKYGV